MANSAGQQKSSGQLIAESPVGEPMRVEYDGATIADSADVIRVDEPGKPTRYYFSRTDVCTDVLSRSGATMQNPELGTADYFNLRVAGGELPDAAWSFEHPCVEHDALQGRIAFHDDKYPKLELVKTTR